MNGQMKNAQKKNCEIFKKRILVDIGAKHSCNTECCAELTWLRLCMSSCRDTGGGRLSSFSVEAKN